MPFATCRRCDALFIVGEEETQNGVLCPYCGGLLEPTTAEEAQQRIRKKWEDETDGKDTPGVRPAEGRLSRHFLAGLWERAAARFTGTSIPRAR